MSTPTLLDISEQLLDGTSLSEHKLFLDLGRCIIAISSNSAVLLQRLQTYFSHWLIVDRQADMEIIAVEREVVQLPVMFHDWRREPGKSGRKDSYYDIEDGRIIRKVRTGMVFLQSEQYRIVAGPCANNDNQVINFINNQYMTWFQRQGWLNCHAAAIVKDNQAYAVAGFSGGGKSTLMLQMLETAGTSFLTNDRLFIQHHNHQVLAAGVPKLPRINPGTIIHNPRLQKLLSTEEQTKLQMLPSQDLWELEQKYDVDIETLYGAGRIISEAPLQSLLILNWQRESSQSLRMQKVDLRQRRDLLQAIMKSSGPFYQQSDGHFATDSYQFDEEAYLNRLEKITVFEATGQVNFDTLAANYLMSREIM